MQPTSVNAPECPALARPIDNLFQRGPVIRDLGVPEEELVLKPSRLRSGRRHRSGRLLSRFYGTALLAWTLGLVAATSGFFQAQRGNQGGVEAQPDAGGLEIAAPERPAPVRIEPVTAAARP